MATPGQGPTIAYQTIQMAPAPTHQHILLSTAAPAQLLSATAINNALAAQQQQQ